MNYFWSTSTSQQQHHHARLSLAKHWKSWERLQAAEQQLIEIARCTWTLNATNPSAPVPEVTVADTPIPASSVWKKSAAGDERSSLLSRWFCSSSSSRCEEVMKQRKEETENPTETLVMHSIQIENHQAPQNDVPLVLLHGYSKFIGHLMHVGAVLLAEYLILTGVFLSVLNSEWRGVFLSQLDGSIPIFWKNSCPRFIGMGFIQSTRFLTTYHHNYVTPERGGCDHPFNPVFGRFLCGIAGSLAKNTKYRSNDFGRT
jgi:hypothetical protein